MQNTKLAKYWLGLATIALGLSGIFAITQILARTTNLFQSVAAKNFHTVSLILHVNLSVLTWFFAISCMIFALNNQSERKFTFYLAASGMGLMTISPFISDGEAFLNNYVPFFSNGIFSFGMVLIFTSLIFECIHNSFIGKNVETKTLAMLFAFSFFVFASYAPFNVETKNTHAYYESLFWEFGHILQFAFVQIMLICWVALADKLGAVTKENKKTFQKLYPLSTFLVSLTTLMIFFAGVPDGAFSHQLFSLQMIALIGVIPFIFGVILCKNLWKKMKFKNFTNPSFSALFFSILLFALGGGLASIAAKFYMQGEESTIIPAHYHGSVIAITVAVMGYIYTLLPKFGVREVKPKFANLQIWFYASGQIIYIVCLAILGGHGAPRKTPGTHGIDVNQAVYHIMHLSGLFLMIGGFMFVYLILKSLLASPAAPQRKLLSR